MYKFELPKKQTDKPANQVNLTKVQLSFQRAGSVPQFYDLLPDMLKIEMDESIDDNSMSMNITFLDSTNLTNKIDFDGTETIQIDFHTLGDREVSAKYRIYKNDIVPDNTGNTKGVVLYGVSEEHFKSAVLDVNQSYREQISGFAKNVFDKLGSEKEIEIHETSGRGVTIIPGMTPFESMDFLASRAYDTSYRSSAYKFFETLSGFHFVNIEKTIAEGKKNALTYVKVQDARTGLPKWNHVSTLNLQVAKDSMHKIKSGMYASEAKEVDLINHKVVTSDFVLAEQFDEFEHLDQDAMSLESVDFIEDSLNIINTSFWLFSGQTGETDNQSLNFVDIIPRRMYYLSALEQVKASMEIPGHSSMSPGMVINLDMLEVTSKTKGKEQEGKISGNYFVTDVKHLITRDEYVCLIKTCKDSYRSNVPVPEKNIVSKRTS